jgi:hypothetical protein
MVGCGGPGVIMNVLAVLLALFFGLLGAAKILALPAMRERAAHLRYAVSAYRLIGVAEVFGAAGLLVGMAWPPVGVLAAACLLLLVGGAVVAHLRNGDGGRLYAPAVVAAVVVGAYLAVAAGAW